MSQKKDKERKRQKIRQKSIEKARRRKAKEQKKRKKSDQRLAKKARVDNLTAQLQEQQEPTFNRGAFQASVPPSNTQHGSVRSAVLSSKKPKVGFDKNAWKPPSEESEEQLEEKPAVVGFDRAAWAPPNGNTED